MASLRQRLRAGETVYGTMVTLPSPAVAEILAGLGFDWLFVDGEHGPLETSEIVGILQAAQPNSSCLVRVPAAEESPIKKVLDLGADGIIVPQVNDAETASRIVQWSRYAPEGARGIGLARAQGYGFRFKDYLSSANEDVTVVVQAEHARAVENIEEIVKVRGVDAVLIGPYDLSASLGVLGQIDHPKVTEAIDHVTSTCQNAKIPLGYFGMDAAGVLPYKQRGYQLVVAGVDTFLLGKSAQQLLSEMQQGK